ncbi:hypothetical protein PBY51_014375 [Eleginops maclovinus]|uniref:Uncharacterized protein n=1 Tax=Eleginops maclovinus TaxID=56733 RepID=A0AAN7WLN6_ELEMC|nr:hypothetical protein PBY51_014375 [Eleginops maclovinus]
MAGSECLDSSSDATLEMGDDALPRHRLFDFSLYLSFQLHWITVLCLPCSAGLVLIVARESMLPGKGGKEKRWKTQTLDAKGNDA